MSRNDISYFSKSPRADIKRSVIGRTSDFKTTMKAGELVPFYVDEILPGDTFSVNTSAMVRMSTPLVPSMDNAYLDYYYFYVPSRIVWEHFENFYGASESAWDDGIEYEIPQLAVPQDGFRLGSIADYFGIPTYTGQGDSVNVLPFRCYQKIWNDFFRDVNLMDEVMMNKGDTVDAEEAERLQRPYPVSKFHDYFTSALPQPQRGDAVDIPAFDGSVPVFSGDINTNYVGDYGSLTGVAMFTPTLSYSGAHSLLASSTVYGSGSRLVVDGEEEVVSPQDAAPVYFRNLYADLSKADAITINQLREALQIQTILEADARGGNRFTSLIRSHFGVISPDGRLQRAEYLGGKRVSLKTQEVTQTSGVLSSKPLGTVGAMSKTVDSANSFTKSFTEPGYLIGVMCIRADRSYQQGLNRMWSRKRRFDFYYPELANIGEQPILNKEIYWMNANDDIKINDVIKKGSVRNEEGFGYNEAWADYRYRPSLVTGYFRSNATGDHEDLDGNALAGSLDYWHYGEYFDSLPLLSEDWIKEDGDIFNRQLAVSDNLTHPFLVDMFFDVQATRPMPLYSIPGIGTHF